MPDPEEPAEERAEEVQANGEAPSSVDELDATSPTTYRDVQNTVQTLSSQDVEPYLWRSKVIQRIEALTGRRLLCYVARTSNLEDQVPGEDVGARAAINDDDVFGISDLIQSTPGDEADILIVSNGGSAEAAEQIVRLLRRNYEGLRFLIPGPAYSAATLMCFAGDELIMDENGTLGPIDPQLNGVPTRAITEGFENAVKEIEKRGAKAIPAYVPLIKQYSLHVFEICEAAEDLAHELAETWLRNYMFSEEVANEEAPDFDTIIEFFTRRQQSHSRTIPAEKASEVGLKVTLSEEHGDLQPLLRSLYYQFRVFLQGTPFIKVFENGTGLSWGRRARMEVSEGE